MKNQLFEVKIYYSGFCTYKVQAEDEIAAILNARSMSINKSELLSNLENWKEADEAIKIENEKRNN